MMVIIRGNGHGNPSSNPRRSCLYLLSTNIMYQTTQEFRVTYFFKSVNKKFLK